MVIARLDIDFPWQYHVDDFIYLRSSFTASYFISARVAPVILLWKRDLICINKLISKRSQELYNSMCFAHIKPSNLIPYFKAEGLPGKNLRKNLKLTKRLQNNLEQHTSEFFTQWRRNIKKPCEITMWEITLTPLVDSKRFHSSPQP